MSQDPVAEGPEYAQGSGGTVEAAGPRRNPMPWLLVTVLAVLAGVLLFAVVMVVAMLA
ncbi:hypothetical protein [Yinghuangia soli]|uniref:Uncharacterized protein n=1 Tax=Yinghuangia soli TaxID=2908204 RepID=A0AA41PUV9_9ACTN|nr:hypothetical protein [Yinghuangia soli]MCF2525755.1 hypothetical protein [Yinghuangia soli]